MLTNLLVTIVLGGAPVTLALKDYPINDGSDPVCYGPYTEHDLTNDCAGSSGSTEEFYFDDTAPYRVADHTDPTLLANFTGTGYFDLMGRGEAYVALFGPTSNCPADYFPPQYSLCIGGTIVVGVVVRYWYASDTAYVDRTCEWQQTGGGYGNVFYGPVANNITWLNGRVMKFDPAIGALSKVTFRYVGCSVDSTVGVENLYGALERVTYGAQLHTYTQSLRIAAQ